MTNLLLHTVLNGETLQKEALMDLWEAPLDELCRAADHIRERFCGNAFDLCTIVNGKSGRCPENCKFCAQSSHYRTEIEEYPLLDTNALCDAAAYNDKRGVLRFSVVTSGRRLNDREVDILCDSYRTIRKRCGISLCASHGLLSAEQFQKLRKAGVTRYHNNLETSRRFFPQVCTTHVYEDKLRAIADARAAGLEVCSGGILGLGETREDRVDMALELRELDIRSAPINVISPIPGTPMENMPQLDEEEICRSVAIFRFALPGAALRMAGGRGQMAGAGRRVFQSGANAAISGDMLTTPGITIEKDLKLLKELGFEVKLL